MKNKIENNLRSMKKNYDELYVTLNNWYMVYRNVVHADKVDMKSKLICCNSCIAVNFVLIRVLQPQITWPLMPA